MALVEFTADDITYNLADKSYSVNITDASQASFAVVKGSSKQGILSVPDSVTYQNRKFAVVGIKSIAFQNNSKILEVHLPNTLRYIGLSAFQSSSLVKINLPDSLQTIEYRAFSGSKLQEVTLPDSLKSIGYEAFKDTRITSINIPKNIERIEKNTFQNCLSLAKVTFATESKLIEIGTYAFSGCSILRNISIPSSVFNLGAYCFNGCGNLESITLSPKIQSIPDHCFYNCINLQDIDLPKSLSEIGSYAFVGCESLKSIAFPEYTLEVMTRAFSACSNLTEVFIPKGLKISDVREPFAGCPIQKVYLNSFPSPFYSTEVFSKNSMIYVPVGMKSQYSSTDPHYIEQNLSITLSKKTMVVGHAAKLDYTTAPVKLPLTNEMQWRSSNPEVATVDANGVVNPIAPGKTVISLATTCDGIELAASTVVNVTEAPNTHFSIADVAVPAGQLMEIPVVMTNQESITSFQCDITLPAGFEADMTDEGLNLQLSDRKRSTHVIEGAVQPDGKIRVIAYSTRNSTFSGNDGILFTLGVRAAKATPGAHQINIDEIYCVDNSGLELAIDPALGYVTVEPAVGNGDANGDGEVNVSDVAITVGHILGEQNELFIADNADINGDKRINITDVAGIVTQILTPAASRAQRVAAAAADTDTAAVAVAAESLSVDNFSIAKGQTKRMPIYLNSNTDYSSFQTDIYLPEGLTPVMIDEDGDIFPDVELDANRRTASHIIASAMQPDGALRVLTYSTKNSLFRTAPVSTPLFYINVKADANLSQQLLTVYFKKNIFNTGKVESRFADSSSKINASTTGLDAASTSSLRVWADNSLHVEASEACTLPVTMLDGRVITLDIVPGHNTFPIAPGIYLAAGQKLVVK